MRWSIQELLRAWSYKKTYGNIFKKIFFTPVRVWKRLKVFLFWLFRGYTKEGLWDLNDLVLRDLEFRISKFIKYANMSYPGNYTSHSVWIRELIEFNMALNKMNNEFYTTLASDLPRKIVKTPTTIKGVQVDTWSVKYDEAVAIENRRLCEKQKENDTFVLEKLPLIIRDLWD